MALIQQVVEGAVIQLVTRCSSAEEFIERFARFTTGTEVVVPAVPHVTVGTDGHFVILLKDRSVIMQGRCEVTEIRPVAVPPGAPPADAGRALMRLRLREMDAHSAGVHLTLMERRAATAKAQGAPSPPPATRTQARLSLVPPAPAPAVEARRSETVVPAASAAPALSRPSLPGMPAPVMAGAAALDRAAGAVAAVAAPTETEPTEVSTLPQKEARVPGASFTLPANPLSDLDAADLASFVDFTLLETKGVVDAVASAGDTAGVAVGAPAAADAARAVAASAAAETRVARARRIARRVAPYASCVLAGLLLGIALRPGHKVAPVAIAAPVVPPPVAAAPPPSPPSNDLPDPVPRACEARVTTTPAGAAVFWGDIALGASPIERAAIPCGTAVVTFRRERYAETTRTITTERGRVAVITERLYRPPAKLVVTSSPPHAAIKLNRQRFGATPRKINAQRFEHVRIEASLPGYRPWRKTVYLREPESKIDVTLERIPARSTRTSPRT